jgi:hypothetical protein
VVSGDESLRSRFEAVTELSGWSACDAPIDVADVDAAVDGDYQLVVVDIARPLGRRVNDSIEVAEEFAGRPGSLLVICGSEDSAEEELRRGLGRHARVALCRCTAAVGAPWSLGVRLNSATGRVGR